MAHLCFEVVAKQDVAVFALHQPPGLKGLQRCQQLSLPADLSTSAMWPVWLRPAIHVFPQLIVFSSLVVVVVKVMVLLLLLLLFLLPADLSTSTTWPAWLRPAIHVSSTVSIFLFADGGGGGEGRDDFAAVVAAAIPAPCRPVHFYYVASLAEASNPRFLNCQYFLVC